MRYWLYIGGETYGPYEAEQLAGVGRFTKETLVCPEGAVGGKDWVQAGTIPELQLTLAMPRPNKTLPPDAPSPAPAPSAPKGNPLVPCPKCNQNITEDSLFCNKCGFNLTAPLELSSSVSTPEPPSARFGPLLEKGRRFAVPAILSVAVAALAWQTPRFLKRRQAAPLPPEAPAEPIPAPKPPEAPPPPPAPAAPAAPPKANPPRVKPKISPKAKAKPSPSKATTPKPQPFPKPVIPARGQAAKPKPDGIRLPGLPDAVGDDSRWKCPVPEFYSAPAVEMDWFRGAGQGTAPDEARAAALKNIWKLVRGAVAVSLDEAEIELIAGPQYDRLDVAKHVETLLPSSALAAEVRQDARKRCGEQHFARLGLEKRRAFDFLKKDKSFKETLVQRLAQANHDDASEY